MTLPGMPIKVGDAIEPGQMEIGRRRPGDTAKFVGEARAAPRRTWLVLTLCMTCNPRTGVYCTEHNARNWWLTKWGRAGKENAPGSTS